MKASTATTSANGRSSGSAKATTVAVELNTSVVANVLHEFVGAIAAQSGCDIELELTEGAVLTVARYNATFKLFSSLTIPVPEIAVRHAGDPKAFLNELVEEQLRPFGSRLHDAADAAAAAWEKTFYGR